MASTSSNANSNGNGSSGNGSGVSMMKEYIKKQLKYWIENFRDDMLPRDFGTKSFSRNTITLHKIELKLHKVAAMLQIPKPLLVTKAYCSEVVIKVPSWSAADKFVQEPLSFRVVDLFIDIKSAFDCDEAYRKASDARVLAAIIEPDPLGSIASWYAFSTIISERLELVVDNIYIKVFSKGISRIRLELTDFHSRTTNAMWQDMRDLTTCVDRSPDGLLKTRFKFISFSCSILLTQFESSNDSNNSTPPLQILRDHEVTMRMTLFGHRQSKSQSWETLSQVIDVNLHTLPFDYEIAQLLQIYQIFSMVSGWVREAAEQERAAATSGAGLLLHHHQIHRSEVMKSTGNGNEEISNEASFALQLTFRFTAEAKLRFISERLGKQHLALVARHAAVNLIVHHDNVRELQVTVHEMSVHFQDQLVLYLKPDRDVMQLKELRESIFVKWHLQKLACNIKSDLALILNEAYHAHNEKEQSAFIKCGTCAQQIRLESIETHVCGPIRSPASSTASSSIASQFSSRSMSDAQYSELGSLDNGEPFHPPNESGKILDSTTVPKLRLVFALDELELNIDSHLFHNVQQLMRSSHSKKPTSELVERKFAVQMKKLSITTEAKEFVGDAIFVPVLPLAFQMLECTLQGCGCIHNSNKKAKDCANSRTSSQESSTDSTANLLSPSLVRLPRWPDRVFVELGHLKCTAKSPHNQSALESFFIAEAIALRASFSDGERICVNCHPQMSLHTSVDRIRCQLDHPAFKFLRKSFSKAHNTLQGTFIIAQTLFLAVLEIRTIEFTLLEASSKVARLKNLFKQVNIVGDNQLGHLSLQSSLDFRALLNSQLIQFSHRKDLAVSTSSRLDGDTEVKEGDGTGSQPQGAVSRAQSRRIRQERERQRAVRAIQRVFRRHTMLQDSKKVLSEQLEPSEPTLSSVEPIASHEDGSGDDTQAAQTPRIEHHCNDDDVVPLPIQKHKGSSGSTPSLFGGVPDDLMNANKKMVAAASVISKFVKNTHQQFESEVAGIATQSKESAARLVMPRYSACKKLFGLEATRAPSHKLKSEGSNATMNDKPKDQEVRRSELDTEVEAEASRRSNSASSSSRSLTLDPTESPEVITAICDPGDHVEQGEALEGQRESLAQREEAVGELCAENEVADEEKEVRDGDGDEAESSEHEQMIEEEQQKEDEDDDKLTDDFQPPSQEGEEQQVQHEPEFGLDEALLQKLPDVIRVLVQVNEYRVRVPINPREKVGFLCREIVRRFNEMFASHAGFISYVTLQDSKGGVFASNDIVGFVYANEDEVFFALPRQLDAKIRSVAHIEPVAKSSTSTLGGGSKRARGSKSKRVGSRFSRCSQLPLPLAIALLANESERDLMRCVLSDGSFGSSSANGCDSDGKQVDEWPELALNVSFLDPSHILPVEMRWFGKCLEVTNIDAFVLCLQQLGLCTSRPSSKYVGKILRDRLKVDSKNVFVRSACARNPELVRDAEGDEGEDTVGNGSEEERGEECDEKMPVSYASLKEIVQEDYGVYTMSSRT